MSEETITITKAEYDRLDKRSVFLDALDAAGVDNWEGFEYAHEIFEMGSDDSFSFYE